MNDMAGRFKSGRQSPGSQRGWTLLIALVILIMLTLIGITAMRTTTLEEKMAGNLRDQNLAFQAAETALRGAEQFISSLIDTSSFGSSPPLYGLDYDEPSTGSLHSSGTWSTATPYSVSLAGVNSNPRYFIKMIEVTDTEGAQNIQGYGEPNPGTRSTVFRITARGTGGSDNSQVILRAYYGKIF